MKRLLLLHITAALIAACNADLEDGSTDETTASESCVDERALVDFEAAWRVAVEAAFRRFVADGSETDACVPGLCGWCKFNVVPPRAHCQISTPTGGCSGWCDLQGCGTSCW